MDSFALHRSSSSLPTPLTPLIGRERELADVVALVCNRDVRLITLIGPGGVGKTRLAIEAARQATDTFTEGIWFVDLAPITDPNLVTLAIALALGVRTGADPLQILQAALAHRRSMLLILDNFEQVVDAAPHVVHLLAHSPGLTALVTSREPLHVSGEQEYPVAPLPLPEDAGTDLPEEVRRPDAVRLFVNRAQAVLPTFTLTAQNRASVAEICRRLDGLPLAIELAASRVKGLPPHALLARLEQRLQLLSGARRDLPERQQTMRHAIAWSYGLLHPSEQALFRKLSVFVDGFALAGAEAISHGDTSATVLDGVLTLLDKSLLRQSEGERLESRFSMLETVRAFGLEQLAATGEIETVRKRHADYFTALAEQAESEFFGPQEIAQLDRCQTELGNIRAALEWSTSNGGVPALGLRLAAALWWFWLRRIGLHEGREWLERGLKWGSAPPDVRAKALAIAGEIANFQADYDRALEWLEESLALHQTITDPIGLAQAQFFLGDCHQNRGELGASIQPLEDALAGFRSIGATGWAGCTVYYLANVPTKAEPPDYDRARALCEEALTLCRTAGFETGVAMTMGRLGTLTYKQSRYEEAERYLHEALALRLEGDDRYGIPVQLTDLAYVAAARGKAELAVRLTSAASAIRRTTGAEIDRVNRAEYDRLIATLRDALGTTRFDDLWSAGDVLTAEQAIAFARELIGIAPPGTIAPAPPGPTGLTPRERDVLRLLTEGKSDREIAEGLFIGTRTVETHVSNLIAKLGVHNRTEAAAFAVREGLV